MKSQRGLTLPEVVIFIVIMGIALAGMFALFSQITRQSPDPLVRKQALAIAQSLMEEIQLRGFTYCDPDDADVYTADDTAGCAITAPNSVEVIGPEGCPGACETRHGATAVTRFDNVSDYAGFSMAGANIKDLKGDQVFGLEAYSASVSIADVTATPNDFSTLAVPGGSGDALLITVTVSGPLSVTVTLQGYRLRYAPNSP